MSLFRRIAMLLLILSLLVACAAPAAPAGQDAAPAGEAPAAAPQQDPAPTGEAPPQEPTATPQDQASAPGDRASSGCEEAGQDPVPDDIPMAETDVDFDNIFVTGLDSDIRLVMTESIVRQPGIFIEFPGLDEVERSTIPIGAVAESLEELFGVPPQLDLPEDSPLTFAMIPVLRGDSVLPDLGGDATAEMKLAAAVTTIRSVSRDFYLDGVTILPVFAELNLSTALVQPSDPGITFDPNGVGAHPCGPLSEGGASLDAFWNQWAFREYPGIGLMKSGSPTPHAGCDSPSSPTQVVVFDTSAFALGGNGGGDTSSVAIDMLTPCAGHSGILDLQVSDYVPVGPVPDDLKHHGLFATVLAYAVSPHSQFHLARVLDDQGSGYLSYLLRAMAHWTNNALVGQFPMVFNLSLGLNPTLVELSPSDLDLVLNELEIDPGTFNDFASAPPLNTDAAAPAFSSDDWAPQVAMEMLVSIACDAGIVVVAASGNDSTLEQYPAVYAPVLGVGASTKASTRSCYSNQGDVFVAAGDAGSVGCDPQQIASCIDEECEFGILSLIGEAPPYRLAFWTGTSFAAPLATGMVALRLNQVGAPPSADLRGAVERFVRDVQNPAEGECLPLLATAGGNPASPDRCVLHVNRVMNITYQ